MSRKFLLIVNKQNSCSVIVFNQPNKHELNKTLTWCAITGKWSVTSKHATVHLAGRVKSRPTIQRGLTCSAADSVHGCRAPPFVFLGVVTLHWAQTMRSIKPTHSVEEAVNDSHAHPYSPGQHGGHQLPWVSVWVISAWKAHTISGAQTQSLT